MKNEKKSKKYVSNNIDNIENIIDILEKEFPNAICGLNFNNELELVCALILAAQCTDARVNTIIPLLFSKYKNVYELSKADINDIQQIIKPCGFYVNKSKSILNMANLLVKEFNGIVPNTMEELIKLPGIGRKSANIILQECFNTTVGIAVDTHVTRISRKLGFSNANTQEKIEIELMQKFDKKYWKTINHVFVLHGRKYCIARNPKCDICPIEKYCIKND